PTRTCCPLRTCKPYPRPHPPRPPSAGAPSQAERNRDFTDAHPSGCGQRQTAQIMLDTDTKRRIDTARDILVGKVPDPKSQVEQITIALIYKFMDDMDAEAEELGGKL